MCMQGASGCQGGNAGASQPAGTRNLAAAVAGCADLGSPGTTIRLCAGVRPCSGRQPVALQGMQLLLPPLCCNTCLSVNALQACHVSCFEAESNVDDTARHESDLAACESQPSGIMAWHAYDYAGSFSEPQYKAMASAHYHSMMPCCGTTRSMQCTPRTMPMPRRVPAGHARGNSGAQQPGQSSQHHSHGSRLPLQPVPALQPTATAAAAAALHQRARFGHVSCCEGAAGCWGVGKAAIGARRWLIAATAAWRLLVGCD